MNTRAEILASTLESGARALAALASSLTPTEWEMPMPRDGRKVGVTTATNVEEGAAKSAQGLTKALAHGVSSGANDRALLTTPAAGARVFSVGVRSST